MTREDLQREREANSRSPMNTMKRLVAKLKLQLQEKEKQQQVRELGVGEYLSGGQGVLFMQLVKGCRGFYYVVAVGIPNLFKWCC